MIALQVPLKFSMCKLPRAGLLPIRLRRCSKARFGVLRTQNKGFFFFLGGGGVTVMYDLTMDVLCESHRARSTVMMGGQKSPWTWESGHRDISLEDEEIRPAAVLGVDYH